MKFALAIRILLLGFVVFPARSQQYASAGALQHESGSWQISIHLEENVDPTGATDPARYELAGVEIRDGRWFPASRSVVLDVNGLPSGANPSVKLSGFTTTDGASLPPLTLQIDPREERWTTVGANEFGYPSQAIAYGNGNFDLISGASQLYGRYDEAVFVYERVTGDFDIKVRVVDQEPSSYYAKAGLMIREALDAGRPRPGDDSDPAQAFSRYIAVEANPLAGVMGEDDANKMFEVAFRPYKGGIGSPNDPTELYFYGPTPAYPNAWVRFSRVGNTVTAFNSTNGDQWTQLGSFVFPAPTLSEALFAGVFYSPETGNIPATSGERRAFLARFADYALTGGGVVGDVELTIQKVGSEVEVSWPGSGTLQAATSLVTPDWQTAGSSSPHRTTPEGTRFYRLLVAP